MTEQVYAVIKLVTGDEVFGKIDDSVNEGSSVLVVYDPLLEVEYFNDDGSSKAVMKRYSFATHENIVPFIKNSIVALSTMSEPFIEYYKAAVEINKVSSQAYDNKITDMAAKMFHHLYLLDKDGGDLTYIRTDTDTMH